MPKYKTDLQDIYFNLFDVLKVQDHSEFEAGDLRDVIEQYDKFNENEVWPTRQESDEKGVHKEGDVITVPTVFKKLNQLYYENGWFALGIDEEWGGMPLPEVIKSVVLSLCSGANVAYSMYPGLSKAALNVVLQIGSDEQKKVHVEKMMSGEWGGTMCLTEAGAGSDVGALRTTATPIEGDRYKIVGEKIFISSGDNDLYSNIMHLVLARTPKGEPGTKGISLFIVPKYKIKDDGTNGELNDVICTNIEEKMGLHGQATCQLAFGQDGSCEGWLIGKEFEGMQNMFIMMNEARLYCGIQGEGQALLAYELAKQYATERGQFATEIANHPDVRRTLFKMRCMSRGLRSMILYTGDLFDRFENGEKECHDEIEFLTPLCKSFCSDHGFNVTVDAIQVYGGYGYCTEYGIEQFARDSKIATIYEGTNGIQAIDFVMRKILKNQGKTFMKLGERINACLKSEEAKLFDNECQILDECRRKSYRVMVRFTEYAQAKQITKILQHATDFQDLCGYIMVGWRLLESAIVAQNKLTNNAPSGDEKKYLESKVTDFEMFAHSYLYPAHGIADSIMEFEKDLTGIEL